MPSFKVSRESSKFFVIVLIVHRAINNWILGTTLSFYSYKLSISFYSLFLSITSSMSSKEYQTLTNE